MEPPAVYESMTGVSSALDEASAANWFVHFVDSGCSMGDAPLRYAPRPFGIGVAVAVVVCSLCRGCVVLPRVLFSKADCSVGTATPAPTAVAVAAAACASNRRGAWRSMISCVVCVVEKSGSTCVPERAN